MGQGLQDKADSEDLRSPTIYTDDVLAHASFPTDDHFESLTLPTTIAINYGKDAWRAMQSIIDIIQNPLDASTTVYEKELLAKVGITTYQPNNLDQQKVVGAINELKEATAAQVIAEKYNTLASLIPSSIPTCDSLKLALATVEFSIPRLELLMSDGTQKQWRPYGQVAELPDNYTIEGFRVFDRGSGFDHATLGLMGASTKSESATKRGGLGEGLRMSILHLVRSGADVRISSINQDEAWTVVAKDQNDELVFDGRRRVFGKPRQTSGSSTIVRFDSTRMEEAVKATLVSELDPRQGEGLGRGCLEYRDPAFVRTVDENCEVFTKGVPSGRLYVKNLLVESDCGTALSYNIANKWAIGGRDRKTVKDEAMSLALRETLCGLESDAAREIILSAGISGMAAKELGVLGDIKSVTAQQSELWKSSIESVFKFTPGKDIFAVGSGTIEKRLAEENGYSVIELSENAAPLLDFFETVYGGEVVTLRNVREGKSRVVGAQKDGAIESNDISFEGIQPIPQEVLEAFEDARRMVVEKLSNSGDRLDSYSVRTAEGTSMQLSATGQYELVHGNVVQSIALEKFIPGSFHSTCDLELEILKFALMKEVFDSGIQQVLESAVGRSISEETGVTQVVTQKLPNLQSVSRAKAGSHYSAEQRKSDAVIKEWNELVSDLLLKDMPLSKVQEIAQTTKEIWESLPLTDRNNLKSWSIILFDSGKIYNVDCYSSMKEVPVKKYGSPLIAPEAGSEKISEKKSLSGYKVDLTLDSILSSRSFVSPSKAPFGALMFDFDSAPLSSFGSITNDSNSNSLSTTSKSTSRHVLVENANSPVLLEGGLKFYIPTLVTPGRTLSLEFESQGKKAEMTLSRVNNRMMVRTSGDNITPEFNPISNEIPKTVLGGHRLRTIEQ